MKNFIFFMSAALLLIWSLVFNGDSLMSPQPNSCEIQTVACHKTASYGGFSASGVAFGSCKPCEEGSCASAYASACDAAYNMAFQTALNKWLAAQVPTNQRIKLPDNDDGR